MMGGCAKNASRPPRLTQSFFFLSPLCKESWGRRGPVFAACSHSRQNSCNFLQHNLHTTRANSESFPFSFAGDNKCRSGAPQKRGLGLGGQSEPRETFRCNTLNFGLWRCDRLHQAVCVASCDIFCLPAICACKLCLLRLTKKLLSENAAELRNADQAPGLRTVSGNGETLLAISRSGLVPGQACF
ncbi:hypothetical protein GQ43DRAFT_151355 [Delitschia confertaspora ATCC 74209]|uniref:Uncharacterized protein n=1 Tax=Delitschia confertaspora ATCC 74209 TaxID=1513339 RepID=A0A9P4JFM3_9PLEO|nr:hypothetical protein GQ43DRAFT_151355 [Delitschia confertaspora ATCC 74209]